MPEPVFRAIALHKHFNGVVAADGVSLAVAAGEFRAIIGPNGAGKSTFFNMITGFIAPDRGRIVFEGHDITGLAPYRLFHRGISRTFQITNILADLTVLENVQVALLSRHRRLFDIISSAAAAYIPESQALLELVGLKGLDRSSAEMLSHGDQKRLELAVALANQPRLLLLDEPTAGMAARERIESIETVHRIAKELGLTVIFTEHDMQVVFAVADRISVLHQGRILIEGSPEEIRNSRAVQDVYLGEVAVVIDAPSALETSTDTGGRRA
jgi:branched-chain amino acid transport system ATP-binding protein